MDQLSDEERKKIISAPPVGTWALMIIVSTSMVIAWLFIYFGVFIPRGTVD